ncbi:MAG: hypothetical protein WCO31_03175 [Actinomycetes bacterium]
MSARDRITKADLEAAFTRLIGEGESTAADNAPGAFAGIAAGVATAVTGAYLVGRRRGRSRRSTIEIRRI